MEEYYITSKGTKHIITTPVNFTNDYAYLNVSYKNITQLILNKKYNTLYCNNNKLTELIIPDGIEYVVCYNNNLSNLIIPNSVKTLFCDINALDIIKYKHANITIHTVI